MSTTATENSHTAYIFSILTKVKKHFCAFATNRPCQAAAFFAYPALLFVNIANRL